MLDSARHFQSPEFIERFIDWMALHKLNVLHWHLTDDQGWRLEIKQVPAAHRGRRLARAGGRGAGRRHRSGDRRAARLRRLLHAGRRCGDIVAYAAERGVTIVPEIEMPGHAQAAIAALSAARRHDGRAAAGPAGLGRLPTTSSTSTTRRSPSSRTCSPK